jgi:molybdate transport system permease protein
MGSLGDILRISILVSLAATLLLLPTSMLLAWLLTHREGRWRRPLEVFISLPLVIPPTVTGFVLLLLLGRYGPIGRLLAPLGLEVAFTAGAAVIACFTVALPLAVRPLVVAMGDVDPQLEKAARTLGAGEWRVFWEVTMPLSLRGVIAGQLLAFARSLGEFGATIIVAGNIPGVTQTLPLAVYTAVTTGADRDATLLTVVAILLAILLVTALALVEGSLVSDRRLEKGRGGRTAGRSNVS